MCFHMYIHVCACMRVCTFLQYLSTSIEIIEISISGFAPPPPPPPILKSFLRIRTKPQSLGHHLKHKIILLSFLKVRKGAKIRIDTIKCHT